MFRSINNFLYRSKDPTRLWTPDLKRVSVDLLTCTLCGIPVGGLVQPGAAVEALGPTQDAKKAARGFFEWYSQGVSALVDEGRLYDFTIAIRGWSKRIGNFPGAITASGQPLDVASLSPDALQERLGEPFARSTKGDLILFYEYDHAEVEYAFNDDDTLASIEFAYEPELAVKQARKYYGIDKELPEHLAERKLS